MNRRIWLRSTGLAAVSASLILILTSCSGTDSKADAGTSAAASRGGAAASAQSATPASGSASASASSSAAGASTAATEPPTTTAGPTPSTSGPAPSKGNINQTVAPVTPTALPVVPLTQSVDFPSKVSVKIDAIDSVDATAKLPGEISGPAIVVNVSITNPTTTAIGLNSVVVTATGTSGVPASEISTDPARPLSGVLEPGKSATGKYVFTMPKDQRSDIRVTVQYASDEGIASFQGSA